MNKIFPLCLTLLFLFSCNKNNKNTDLKPIDFVSFAFSPSLLHFQTQSEIQILKNNKVKSVSFVIVDNETQKPDSTTFLTYDRKGRFVSRTTSECSSMGCLPYTIRQTFIYSNDTLKTMNDYFFKYKKKSSLDYWLTEDPTKLRFAYDEQYTYSDDTIIVDLMQSTMKYIKDNKGRFIRIEQDLKTNNQYNVVNITYTDSTISTHIFEQDIKYFDYVVLYKYDANENCVYIKNLTKNKIKEKWLFDSNGLPRKIIHYKNGKAKKTEKLKYDFY